MKNSKFVMLILKFDEMLSEFREYFQNMENYGDLQKCLLKFAYFTYILHVITKPTFLTCHACKKIYVSFFSRGRVENK